MISPKQHDPVNYPSHYTRGSIECIDAIESALGYEAFLGYCLGNVMKYIWRAGLKNDLAEDLKKSQWYVNRAIQAVNQHAGE